MSLLRIRTSLAEGPPQCEWALIKDNGEAVLGEGALAAAPHRAGRVQLIISAAQVLLLRTRLPQAAKRHAGSVLAYAVEDALVGEPDGVQASWLGAAGDEDVLALIAKERLGHWLDALHDAGMRAPEVYCETLLLPMHPGQWSLYWDGCEGMVRSGVFEGAATDCGDRAGPPLSLQLMLDDATARSRRPTGLALYLAGPDALPDLAAWQRRLGLAVHIAGPWNWRTASPDAGSALAQGQRRSWRRWRFAPGVAVRLRPAAWIAGAALTLHATALLADWSLLSAEQRTLRQSMVTRFRATFPDAVAVVDPALQMRRKLAEARHAAGQPDRGDFLPMIEQVAAAAGDLQAGAVRNVSYEAGRMTIEFSAVDDARVRRLVARLAEAGLRVDVPLASPAGAKLVLTVRAS